MANKITKRDFYMAIIALINHEDISFAPNEIVDFCDHEIELLDKKHSSGSRKPTKTQVENEGHKATIMEILINATAPMTIKEIQSNAPSLAEFSTSKMSALLTQLVKEDKIEKTYEKKVPHYSAK